LKKQNTSATRRDVLKNLILVSFAAFCAAPNKNLAGQHAADTESLPTPKEQGLTQSI
jgi:hypothetical protein